MAHLSYTYLPLRSDCVNADTARCRGLAPPLWIDAHMPPPSPAGSSIEYARDLDLERESRRIASTVGRFKTLGMLES